MSCSVSAPRGRTPAATTLPSSRPCDALRDCLEIVRVVVLAVDEDDLLRPPGNVEVPLVDEREIAGAQPPIGAERRGVGLGIVEIAAGDVVTAHEQIADLSLRQRPILVIGDAHVAIGNHSPFRHELHRIARAFVDELHGAADPEAVAVERNRAHRLAGWREAHGQRGLREPIHRIHAVARQAGWLEPREELFRELHGDRLRTVEDELDAGEVEALHRPVAEHLEVVLVAEIR